MALSDSSLKGKIISQLEEHGFDTKNQFSKSADLAEAIAKAVVEEIKNNAEVTVSGGSSAGVYKVS